MDVSELKLKIFREIDSLEKVKLQEIYGYLQNFVRGKRKLMNGVYYLMRSSRVF